MFSLYENNVKRLRNREREKKTEKKETFFTDFKQNISRFLSDKAMFSLHVKTSAEKTQLPKSHVHRVFVYMNIYVVGTNL